MARRRGTWRCALVSLLALAAAATLAPAASASIGSPTLTLTPSSAAAASTANLGTDIMFSPSGGDSVKNLALQLPAGLIANAAIDNGACLTSAAVQAACQVGTGTVSATENTLGGVALSLPAEFSLVAPPAAADLAGLAVSVEAPGSTTYEPLGTPAAVVTRPVTDPAGFGLDILFTNIPDTYSVPLLGPTSISVTAINATFKGLHFPSSCPATPANVVVASSSYSDSTVETASAPLTVTGCASLPFSPGFSVSAVHDSSDKQVQITTDITQGAGQATPRSVTLTLPTAVLGPNLSSISQLCANPSSETCQAVGSATATSPLYPTPLSGQAYLTGALSAPSLTLVFGAPFGITLTGPVDLTTNSTTFSGVPDIPLSDLRVELDGGAGGVFASSCVTPSGTATSTLVSQNGDKTVTVPAAFTVADCTLASGGAGQSGGGSSSQPKLSATHVSGLLRGQAAMGFTVSSATGASKLTALTVEPPPGLTIVRHREHGRLRVVGVTLKGATAKALTLSHGHLLITLRAPTAKVTVTLGRSALSESHGLRRKAQYSKVSSLRLTVVTRDATGKRVTLQTRITNLGLPG